MKAIRSLNILLILLGFVQCFISCSKSDDSDQLNPSHIIASFIVSGEENNHLVGESISFTNTTTTNGANVNYIWDFGDSEASTQQSPSHSYSELGDYIVTLSAQSGGAEDNFSKKLLISISSDIDGRNTLVEELSDLDNKIMVCAHRGQHENAPENSLSSISNAITQGVRMVELDVRQTQDGELVLMHDSTIDRTSNGSGAINSMTFQELQQFNLLKDDGTLTTEKIPSLREVFELARGEIYLDLDIDDNKAPYTKVIQLVKQYGMLNQVMFYSSEFSDIISILQSDSNLYAIPMIRNQNEFTTYDNSNLPFSIVHYNSTSFTQNLVTQAKDNGWYIFKNAYVNSNQSPTTDANGQINLIIDLEGDIIQTDYPTQIKNYLATQNLN